MKVDILIQGGGLAGNTLGLALARLGFSIAIIEPFQPQDPFKSQQEARTIALSHTASQLYQELGVWARIEALSTPIRAIHVSDKGHFGMTRIQAREQGLPALGYVLPIAQLNHCLEQALAQEAQVKRFCPAQLTQIERKDGGWKALISQEGQLGQPIEASLLVATDGAKSALRQQMGLAMEEKDYQQIAIVASLKLSQPHQGIAYERFTPSGPIAILPQPGLQATLVLTLKKGEESPWLGYDDATFLKALQDLFGYRLGRFKGLGSRQPYPLKAQYAPIQSAPQFLLMGNAAHAMHPIAAQSFNLILRDIMVFIELAARAKDTDCSIADPDLLQAYESARQADQGRTLQFTDRLITLFSHPLWIGPRNLAMTILDCIPSLKTSLGRYASGALEMKKLRSLSAFLSKEKK